MKTEVLQPYVSVRGAADTAVVAIRQPLEQGTQPFGAWHGGHSLWSLVCSPCPVFYLQRFVEPGADGHLWGICHLWTLRRALHGLSHAAMHGLCGRQRLHSQAYLQMPAAGDLLWIYTAFWRLSGAYAVTVFSTASSLYCKKKQALTLQCFAADAASAAVAVATTCFWDATWPHVLVVHPVHACDPVQLAAWIASG